jgi:hypothetical protein
MCDQSCKNKTSREGYAQWNHYKALARLQIWCSRYLHSCIIKTVLQFTVIKVIQKLRHKSHAGRQIKWYLILHQKSKTWNSNMCVCVCVRARACMCARKGVEGQRDFNRRSVGIRTRPEANVKYLFVTYLRLGHGKNKHRFFSIHPSMRLPLFLTAVTNIKAWSSKNPYKSDIISL